MGVATEADVTHACTADARLYVALRFAAVEVAARSALTRVSLPTAQKAIAQAADTVNKFPRLLADKAGSVALLQGMYALTAGAAPAAAGHFRRAVALLEAAPLLQTDVLPRRTGQDPLLNVARRARGGRCRPLLSPPLPLLLGCGSFPILSF